jgi:hypothetical protein
MEHTAFSIAKALGEKCSESAQKPTSGAEAQRIFQALAARVNSCPSRLLRASTFSAGGEATPDTIKVSLAACY